MRYHTVFEADWGYLLFETSWDKIDLLPRITVSQIDHAVITNVGFMMLSFNLVVFDGLMREFHKRSRRENKE